MSCILIANLPGNLAETFGLANGVDYSGRTIDLYTVRRNGHSFFRDCPELVE